MVPAIQVNGWVAPEGVRCVSSRPALTVAAGSAARTSSPRAVRS